MNRVTVGGSFSEEILFVETTPLDPSVGRFARSGFVVNATSFALCLRETSARIAVRTDPKRVRPRAFQIKL
jgi:hypothetical protein